MPKKKTTKKKRQKKSIIEKEIEEVEDWIIARKKFLIKLGWVAGFITILLIISHLYLRVKAFG